nr:MAG TPA: hypothetical protein [Caudoviricetes sp.]
MNICTILDVEGIFQSPCLVRLLVHSTFIQNAKKKDRPRSCTPEAVRRNKPLF